MYFNTTGDFKCTHYTNIANVFNISNEVISSNFATFWKIIYFMKIFEDNNDHNADDYNDYINSDEEDDDDDECLFCLYPFSYTLHLIAQK